MIKADTTLYNSYCIQELELFSTSIVNLEYNKFYWISDCQCNYEGLL